jgi:hypothetical protein
MAALGGGALCVQAWQDVAIVLLMLRQLPSHASPKLVSSSKLQSSKSCQRSDEMMVLCVTVPMFL